MAKGFVLKRLRSFIAMCDSLAVASVNLFDPKLDVSILPLNTNRIERAQNVLEDTKYYFEHKKSN